MPIPADNRSLRRLRTDELERYRADAERTYDYEAQDAACEEAIRRLRTPGWQPFWLKDEEDKFLPFRTPGALWQEAESLHHLLFFLRQQGSELLIGGYGYRISCFAVARAAAEQGEIPTLVPAEIELILPGIPLEYLCGIGLERFEALLRIIDARKNYVRTSPHWDGGTFYSLPDSDIDYIESLGDQFSDITDDAQRGRLERWLSWVIAGNARQRAQGNKSREGSDRS